MDEERKKLAYLEWIKIYTRNDFIVDGVEEIPLVIDLVIEEMIKHDESMGDIQSESIGDYSVTFAQSESGYSKKIMGMLKPYVKVKFV